MSHLARGAALVDLAGALVAADPGFLRGLGLPAEGAGAALRARAASQPGLAALLEGQGPEALSILGAVGEPLLLERHAGPSGRLLLLRAEGDVERLEHAVRSQGLAALAGGLSHDVNGPLHAMTLQLALLEEKLGDGAEGRLAAGHVAALREQIGRVGALLRRFRDLVDPPAVAEGVELGALVAEALALLRHELDRRAVQHALEGPAGATRLRAAPARAARLVLGVLQGAAARTPDGGALEVEVAAAGGWATLTVRHARGAGAPGVGYDWEAAAGAAAALGGHLVRTSEEGRERVTLSLPRGQVG